MTDPIRLMQGVIPYLTMEDTRAAIAFYERAFGATLEGELTPFPGSDKIANAGLIINGGMLMLADHAPEMGQPPARGGVGYMLTLVVLDGDLWWSRAVAAGCAVVTPFAPQFWGDRYGQLRDPFGIDWAINEPGTDNLAAVARKGA